MHAPDDVRFVLSAYVDAALRDATYDKLDDGSYGGCIPSCPGVVAFGTILRECEDALRDAGGPDTCGPQARASAACARWDRPERRARP